MGRFSEVGKVLEYWNLKKAKRKITRIVIHCSATKQGKYYDAQDIHLWHKARGWAGIGYTYVLLDSGELQQGRGINYTPAQAKGYNKGAIAICLIGGMKDKMIAVKCTDEFRKEVEKVSSQDNKTMTGYITDLILRDFQKRGLRNGKDDS